MKSQSNPRRTLIRLLLATACAAFTTAYATPRATAGEADGVYLIKRISTSDSISIPDDMIAKTVASNNRITITNNQIPIQRNKWIGVLNRFNFVFFGGTAKITGAKSITLEPSGDSFIGSAAKPLVVVLTGSLLGRDIQMKLTTTGRAKLTGDQLVLTFPVRIGSLAEPSASGTVRVVAIRQ